MVQTLYADGIRNMALINGMIRMEYATQGFGERMPEKPGEDS